jgi:hypothetical protein
VIVIVRVAVEAGQDIWKQAATFLSTFPRRLFFSNDRSNLVPCLKEYGQSRSALHLWTGIVPFTSWNNLQLELDRSSCRSRSTSSGQQPQPIPPKKVQVSLSKKNAKHVLTHIAGCVNSVARGRRKIKPT